LCLVACFACSSTSKKEGVRAHESSVSFYRVYDVISYKIELFAVTSVAAILKVITAAMFVITDFGNFRTYEFVVAPSDILFYL
jgi:hypothetical protein